MQKCPDTKIILDFFEGRLRNSEGVTITDVHEFTDFELETDHLFIQWLFPNRRASRVNPEAPLLTSNAVLAVQASEIATRNFEKSVEVMKGFYDRNDHWLAYEDHNHLRISRMIEAIASILGRLPASRFLTEIEKRATDAGDPIHPTAHRIWRGRLKSFD